MMHITVDSKLIPVDLPLALKERLDYLLDKQSRGDELSRKEKEEAKGLVELSELLSLLKTRSKRVN